MSEPNVNIQNRPIYKEEVENFGSMQLEEYRFNFGVYFTNRHNEPIEIPESIGTIIQTREQDDQTIDGFTAETVPCNDTTVFQEVNQELTDESEIAK